MGRLGGLEGNLPKMAAVRFLCWMHWMSAVIIPFFRDWGRLSYTQIFVSAARTLLIGVLYPAIGVILDRSLVAALLFVGALGLAAAIFAAAPASLLREPTESGALD